mmetsp:Transcript_63599/g.113182  ORF Transcript_63599/g.113182 Transcript_63599/m.113182 type:complete len:189 (+) Transcript_63599:47-613(+)
MAARLEFIAGGSSKFWEVSIKGSTATVAFGKIGGAPSTKNFPMGTADAAKSFAEKQKAAKIKKGYVLAGAPKVRPGSTAAPVTIARAVAKAKAKPKAKAAVKKVVMKVKGGGGGKYAGKTLCFTGALSIKRSVATSFAKAKGFTVNGSVSAKTDILVVGNDAGSKIHKGGANLQYWPEKQFLKAVGLA